MDTAEFTQLLADYRPDDEDRSAQLVAAIYGELRRLASRHMAGSRWIATLGTTVLVNESYLRLVSPSARQAGSKRHFLNLASCAMRQIICDYARKRLRKRDGLEAYAGALDTDDAETAELAEARQMVALDDALNDLARTEPRRARVVDCRFFAGLSEEETAQALDTSLRTVQREWNEARRWLADYLGADRPA